MPVAVAVLLGLLVFRQRVRGAYFAVLSQALAAAFVILLVGQQGLTGGTNGLTNFQGFFGLDLYDDGDRRILYLIVVVVLGLSYLAVRQLARSRQIERRGVEPPIAGLSDFEQRLLPLGREAHLGDP